MVVYALALFFFNHLALRVDAHLVNFCMQHALRLHPQAELKLVGGQDFVVKSAVVAGVGVQGSTVGLNQLHVFSPTNVLGALKKKVLKKVSKARAGGYFVLGTHVVKHRYGDQGVAVVLVQDDVESVRKVKGLKLDLCA